MKNRKIKSRNPYAKALFQSERGFKRSCVEHKSPKKYTRKIKHKVV